MDNDRVKIALLLQLLCLIGLGAGQSPCPEYFRYVRDESTNEVVGQIEIPNAPRGVALHIRVALSLAAALPTKYVGRLELAQSKEESVRLVQWGRPLQYRLYFPLRYPSPLLTGLWFNQQQYCAGPRATGQIVTSIFLEHTLFPPGVAPLSQNGNPPIYISDPPVQPQPQPPPTQRPRPRPRPRPPTQSRPRPQPQPQPQPPIFNPPVATPTPTSDVFHDQDCGRSEVHDNFNRGNNINPLIARGEATSPGQWPWVAAIFLVKIDFEFQCAGTLISTKHVITAAHCFEVEGVRLPPNTLLVSLGRYRLRDWWESGALRREVADYKVHPDYKRKPGSADSDLAVTILRESVQFSASIKPICMWSGSLELEPVVGRKGFVVGWGRDELGNPYLAEPRMARVPIISQADCLWSNPNFVTFTSNRTFCAGSRDGSGPCNGDSGSGLVLRDANSGRYHLRGVVSRSLLDSATDSCDLSQYVVYVDVARYLDWIREQIS